MPFEPRPLLLVSKKKLRPLLLSTMEKRGSASSVERNLTISEARDTVNFRSKPEKEFLIEIRELIRKSKDLRENTEELLKDTGDFLKAIHSSEMDIEKIKQLIRKYPELLTRLHKKDVLFGRIKGQDILKQLSLQKDSLKELTKDGSQTAKEQLEKQSEAYQQQREEEWLKMSHMPGGWRDENLADLHNKEEIVMETDNLVEPVIPGSWNEEWSTAPVVESGKSNVPVMQVSSQKSFGGLCASFLSLPKLVSWDKIYCGGK